MRNSVCQQRRGTAAVELAIFLPVLAFLFVIAVDFGRIFYFSLTVTNCARNGAMYGGQKPANALDSAEIVVAAKKDVGTLNVEQLYVTSAVNNTTSPTTLSVTVAYPFRTITGYFGIPNLVTLTRTVQVNVAPLVPGS